MLRSADKEEVGKNVTIPRYHQGKEDIEE